MKQDLVITYIIAAGFVNTARPPTVPLVVHGVPGCGKSTLIRKLLQTGLVQGYTAGPAYGDTLATAGVLKLPTPFTRDPKQETLVLDEYQLADPSTLNLFDVLVGDPYQGSIRREPHFIKEFSHRVPKSIADFLRAHQYQISGDKDGTIAQIPLYATNSRPLPPKGKILHLGPLSRRLTHSHGICSAHPSEVQGQEFNTVTLVCHTSEIQDRAAFYVACTRALKELFIIAEAPIHELRAAT